MLSRTKSFSGMDRDEILRKLERTNPYKLAFALGRDYPSDVVSVFDNEAIMKKYSVKYGINKPSGVDTYKEAVHSWYTMKALNLLGQYFDYDVDPRTGDTIGFDFSGNYGYDNRVTRANSEALWDLYDAAYPYEPNNNEMIRDDFIRSDVIIEDLDKLLNVRVPYKQVSIHYEDEIVDIDPDQDGAITLGDILVVNVDHVDEGDIVEQYKLISSTPHLLVIKPLFIKKQPIDLSD